MVHDISHLHALKMMINHCETFIVAVKPKIVQASFMSVKFIRKNPHSIYKIAPARFYEEYDIEL